MLISLRISDIEFEFVYDPKIRLVLLNVIHTLALEWLDNQ